MKKIQLLIIGITLTLFLFIGCSEYLDVKSDNRIEVPTTLEQLQALLNDHVTMTNETTPSMIENWSDDYFMLPSKYETTDANFQNMYVWKIDLYNHANDWSAAYRPIYNANFCLEGLQKIGRNDENKIRYDRIAGESLFYRAYYFQQLVWAFASVYDESTAMQDVGIVLKLDTDFNTPSIRASVADCYAKIIEDAKQAIVFLPSVAVIPTQPSKQAGHALLARIYLSMRKYDLALKHAEEALDIKSDLMDYNNPADGISSTQTFSFEKYNKETIFYSEMNGFQGNMYISSRGGRIDTLLVQSYLPNDLRKKAFFRNMDQYFAFKGSYAGNRMFTGLALNELFLIQAECRVRLNDVQGGMEDLNHLLKYRFDHTVPFIALQGSNESEALKIILLERRKELLFRGLRFIDIKRLNKEGHNISIKRKINGNEYLLKPNTDLVVPIPTDLKPFIK
ncbi:RagB/SusD family nutrient uptake outer membrane protein [Sphingobacterium anhuiense]|uniref:RagB/SusD family nutrient uptake outer membrane protein n=1 Tax=Sphingobacterium anhuiense TaxID=493780 RepID=A0ABW5YZX0_9SPHI